MDYSLFLSPLLRRVPIAIGRGRLLPYLSVTSNNVLIAGQLFECHWAAGMQLLSTDADLCSQTELSAIGEGGRHIGIYTGCIYHFLKDGNVFGIFTDNSFAVFRRILCDVIDRRRGELRRAENDQSPASQRYGRAGRAFHGRTPPSGVPPTIKKCQTPAAAIGCSKSNSARRRSRNRRPSRRA